jgi:F-type H+-transporting ATPase subunit O
VRLNERALSQKLIFAALLAVFTEVAGKYASAAYSAALSKSENQLKAVESDLNSIHATLEKDASIRDFIANPTLSPSDKQKGVQALLKSVKNGGDEVTKNLFEVLAANGRLQEATKVIEEFKTILAAHRGEISITVTCASFRRQKCMT